MINKAILYSFPIECFEKFKVYENKNFRKFKKIFNTGPHLADGNVKFSIADAVSNGSKLILKQVGGSYGVVKNLGNIAIQSTRQFTRQMVHYTGSMNDFKITYKLNLEKA